MGISEFTVHNVLRTYARQEKLARVQKIKTRPASKPAGAADQVSLSQAGRKIQWLGQFAGELVARQHPDLNGDAAADRVRRTREDLLSRHRDEVMDETLPPEAFEARLRAMYLG